MLFRRSQFGSSRRPQSYTAKSFHLLVITAVDAPVYGLARHRCARDAAGAGAGNHSDSFKFRVKRYL